MPAPSSAKLLAAPPFHVGRRPLRQYHAKKLVHLLPYRSVLSMAIPVYAVAPKYPPHTRVGTCDIALCLALQVHCCCLRRRRCCCCWFSRPISSLESCRHNSTKLGSTRLPP
ncbi:unnamed protein product [Ectocarpus sp. 8 AP-2014]